MQSPYQRQLNASKYGTLFSLLLLLAGLFVLSGNSKESNLFLVGFLLAIFGATIFLVVGILYLVFAYTASKFKKKLQAFKEGDYLGHWICKGEEWETFLQETFRKRNRGHLISAFVFGFILIGLLAWLFSSGMQPHEKNTLALVTVGLFLPVGLYLLFANRGLRRWVEKSRREGGEVYIGNDSFYTSYGEAFVWDNAYTQVIALELLEDPYPHMFFHFSMMASRGGRTFKDFRLPIPYDQMEQAEEVFASLQGDMMAHEMGMRLLYADDETRESTLRGMAAFEVLSNMGPEEREEAIQELLAGMDPEAQERFLATAIELGLLDDMVDE